MKKSVFETLSSINVNDKVEKKNNLTYLSWAWAWGEVKKLYPNATYKVVEDPMSMKPYFFDDMLGYMVMTEVTIEGETLGMWLPVMDGANKSMRHAPYTYQTRYGEKTVEQATMFDINKTIMRCLTKNLAMFGLGHYIYAGEDIPETETQAQAQPKQKSNDKGLISLKKGDENWDKVVGYLQSNAQVADDDLFNRLSQKYNLTATVKKELSKLKTKQDGSSK
jgi:hypothetical protein